MAQKRIDLIYNIIKKHGYVTVKYLCDELHYSTATINRDLNDLKKQKLIVRHYGGAELATQKGTPLVFRYHKMRPIKRLLAKKASKYIDDGMTIFIDGSTTAHYIGQYIPEKKNITVITNNLNLASHLSESGITCICLGGKIIDPPYMIGGNDTVNQAKTYTADLSFFSTMGVSLEGKIYETNEICYELHKVMIENSKKSIFLIDHQKADIIGTRVLCDFSEIDSIISDISFPNTIVNKYPNTEILHVETPKTQK